MMKIKYFTKNEEGACAPSFYAQDANEYQDGERDVASIVLLVKRVI